MDFEKMRARFYDSKKLGESKEVPIEVKEMEVKI